MKYGYENVLEVQRRCGVSFEEADKALKAEKGDVDKACVYAARKKKTKKTLDKNIGSLMNFITYRIRISKGGETKFNVSMGMVILISSPILIFSLCVDEFGMLGLLYFTIFAITVFAGYSLEFTPKEKTYERVLEKVENKEKTVDEVYEQNAEQKVEPETDGYNSIEIE